MYTTEALLKSCRLDLIRRVRVLLTGKTLFKELHEVGDLFDTV